MYGTQTYTTQPGTIQVQPWQQSQPVTVYPQSGYVPGFQGQTGVQTQQGFQGQTGVQGQGNLQTPGGQVIPPQQSSQNQDNRTPPPAPNPGSGSRL